MSTKVIVSYDGTANEDDAIALGRVFAHAGAEVAVAYVRHASEQDPDREALAHSEAREIVDRGVALLGVDGATGHVVTDRSTPEGLRVLAEEQGADVVVFCSDSHTAKGHVAIGNSAERLMRGGKFGVAIAPVDVAERLQGGVSKIVAVGAGDGGALETAQSLADALGAEVAPVINDEASLIVFDSRPEAESGRIAISASATHLIEIATAPVLVLPRDSKLDFDGEHVSV